MSNLLPASAPLAADPFFPSDRFAKVPAEALSALAYSGATAMSHAAFRVLVALCRHRGPSRTVFPSRDKLQKLTGIAPSGISRATKALQAGGWLIIHYTHGNNHLKVENYELLVPVRSHAEHSPGAVKGRRKRKAVAPSADESRLDDEEWFSAHDEYAEPEDAPLLGDSAKAGGGDE